MNLSRNRPVRRLLLAITAVLLVLGLASLGNERGTTQGRPEAQRPVLSPSPLASPVSAGSAPSPGPRASVTTRKARAASRPAASVGWVKMAESPLSKREPAAAVWTGDSVLLWGGVFIRRYPSHLLPGSIGDGAIFSPETDTWKMMKRSPFDKTWFHTIPSAWSGRELFVRGCHTEHSDCDRDAWFWAAYAVGTDSWERLSVEPTPSGRAETLISFWSGRDLVVWSPSSFDAYSPPTRTWRRLRPPSSPFDPGPQPASVWTGTEMILLSSNSHRGIAYNPETDSWRDIADSPLSPRRDASIVWTGTDVVVLGGESPASDGSWERKADGAAYSPTSDTWRPIAPFPPAAGRFGPELVALRGEVFAAPSDMGLAARFDPRSNVWSALPQWPLETRTGSAVIASDREIFIWGGSVKWWEKYENDWVNDGARLAP